MNIPVYGDRDPIAALATPLGESALAIIRCSGGESDNSQSAVELLASVFSHSEKLKNAPANSVIHGWILNAPGGHEKIDEVLVSVYRAPHSYTGEDGADISCHGSIAGSKAIMAALKKAGFREALRGEFTFRAFMNGKLDLTRAESVMELVAAKTDKGRHQALRRLAGVLFREISGIKTLLVQVLAGTEIFLDYSEDEFLVPDDESAGRLPDRKTAEEAFSRLKVLSELWNRERIYTEGALAVIAGRPNAGKSSLFNYLIREDRSIVTDAPGTTRDWIEAQISVEGIPLTLADTAGLRNTILPGANVPDQGISPDKDISTAAYSEAERIGIERSLELLEKADIILYLVNGAEGVTNEDRDFLVRCRENRPDRALLLLWNKADIKPLPFSDKDESTDPVLAISAKTGEGIPELIKLAASLLEKNPSGIKEEDPVGPGTSRQKELIDLSLASIEEALALADRGEPLDIIAPLFRSAVNSLGEITGEVSSMEILETMFSRFCVGK